MKCMVAAAGALLLGAEGASASEIIGYNGQELNYWAKSKAHARASLKKQVLAAIKPHEAAARASANDVHMMNVKHSHEAMFVETPSLDVVRAISALALPPSDGNNEHAAVLGEIKKLASKLAAKNDEALAKAQMPFLEESLSQLSLLLGKGKVDAPVQTKIDAMRAKMCEKNTSSASCKNFMKDYCDPGSDQKMDGDAGEHDHGKDDCKVFFEAQKAEEKKEEEKKEAPVAEESKEAVSDLVSDSNAGPADTPAVGNNLPSQGFRGSKVHHVNGETTTDDWRAEFGPRQRDTYYSICAKHPNNNWCVSHGYGGILRAAENEIKESDYFPLLVLALLTVLAFVGFVRLMA